MDSEHTSPGEACSPWPRPRRPPPPTGPTRLVWEDSVGQWVYHKYSTFEEAAEACKQHNLATRIATDKSIQSSLAVNNALEVLETGGHIEFLVLAQLLADDIINNIKRVPLPSKRILKRMYNARNSHVKLVPEISRNTRPLAFVRSVMGWDEECRGWSGTWGGRIGEDSRGLGRGRVELGSG